MREIWKSVNKFRFFSFIFLLMTLVVLKEVVASDYKDLVFIAYLIVSCFWILDSLQSSINLEEKGK